MDKLALKCWVMKGKKHWETEATSTLEQQRICLVLVFEKEPLPPPRKTRAELMKAIHCEYYGYLDEDDGVIVPLEQDQEKKLRVELVESRERERPGWREMQRKRKRRRSASMLSPRRGQ
jgi:GTPase SAR1 family protein